MRILMVTSRFPWPPWRGNQVRTLEWLRALRDHQWALVCPPSEDPAHHWRPDTGDIRLWTYESNPTARIESLAASALAGRPAQEGLYATRSGRRAVAAALTEQRPEAVIIQMVRCGWALDQVVRDAPNTPVLFDAIDAMGLHFTRAARFAFPLLRPMLALEGQRCRRRERQLARQARLSVAVSERDLDALEAPVGRVVPVSGRAIEPVAGVERLPQVLLSGNLGYRPTVQAAEWFAHAVWPGIVARLPSASWVLAGARPSGAVLRLARLPGVEVHGDVDDLGPFLRRASVAIAPMASGSGVPMKVLEAWAAGLAVVAHPWTAAGVVAEARDGLRVADGADAWRDGILELLSDRNATNRLSERGRGVWRRHYHPRHVARQLREALAAVSGGGG